MEQLEARLESVERVDGDLYLATISILTYWPQADFEGMDQRTYTVEIDAGGRTMTPKDDLQECFDAHHKFAYSYGLNPKLRRQWKTASLIDGIVDRLLKSGLLGPWGLLPETEGDSNV